MVVVVVLDFRREITIERRKFKSRWPVVSIIAARGGVCDGEGPRRWVVRVWRDSCG